MKMTKRALRARYQEKTGMNLQQDSTLLKPIEITAALFIAVVIKLAAGKGLDRTGSGISRNSQGKKHREEQKPEELVFVALCNGEGRGIPSQSRTPADGVPIFLITLRRERDMPPEKHERRVKEQPGIRHRTRNSAEQDRSLEVKFFEVQVLSAMRRLSNRAAGFSTFS
ncbi:hypothetical protein VTI74DRAFT_4836 [Chaetomium olivicolor]